MALPAVWNGWVVIEGDEINQEFRLGTDVVVDGVPTRVYDDLTATPVGKAHVRKNYDDPAPMAVFEVTVVLPQTGEDRGKIRLFMSGPEADKLRAGEAYWDVQLARDEAGAGRRTRLRGTMTIEHQVTFG